MGALVPASGSQVHGLALPGDPDGSSMRRTLINLICYTTGAGTFGVSIALSSARRQPAIAASMASRRLSTGGSSATQQHPADVGDVD